MARRAPQIGLVRPFQSGLSNPVTLTIAILLSPLQLPAGYLGDITKNMRPEHIVMITSLVVDNEFDSRKLVQVLVDSAENLERHLPEESTRLIRAPCSGLVQSGRDRGIRFAQKLCQKSNPLFIEVARCCHQAVGRHIVDQKRSVSIVDQPARRCRNLHPDGILLRLAGVDVRIDDLQIDEPSAEKQDQTGDETYKDLDTNALEVQDSVPPESCALS